MQQIATSASAESDKKRGAIKLLVLSIISLRNFMPNAGTTGTKHDDRDVQCLTGGNAREWDRFVSLNILHISN